MVMESISALADGELGEHQARRELARLKNDTALRERWDYFHLIGDALRAEQPLFLSAGFSGSFAARLAEEPTILAPRGASPQARRVTTYALSAAASLSAVALVGWVALAPNTPLGPQAGLTAEGKAAARLEAPSQLASVPSEGRMNEYLLAHQGFSPSTAIQGLAPYIRSVSATLPAEGR
jgi:sigma-E factor negative regulatory protein RseA